MKVEIAGLKRRVEELEEAMGHKSAVGPYTHQPIQHTRRSSLEPATGVKKINGTNSTSPETAYTFPPTSSSQDPSSSSSSRGLRPENSRPQLSRRLSSPGWGQQHQSNNDRHSAETGRVSPLPFDSRRPTAVPMTMSSTRHELGSSLQSTPRERDRDPSSIAMSSTGRPLPPPLSRQNSAGVPIVVVSSERERERERTPPPTPSSSRRAPGSRRNSVVMTGSGEAS
jgi:hypothetical protein